MYIIVINDYVYVRNIVNIMFRHCNNCLYYPCHMFMCVSVYGDDFNERANYHHCILKGMNI